MLACTPRIVSPSWAVRGFVAGFALFFGLFTRPWRVRIHGARRDPLTCAGRIYWRGTFYPLTT